MCKSWWFSTVLFLMFQQNYNFRWLLKWSNLSRPSLFQCVWDLNRYICLYYILLKVFNEQHVWIFVRKTSIVSLNVSNEMRLSALVLIQFFKVFIYHDSVTNDGTLIYLARWRWRLNTTWSTRAGSNTGSFSRALAFPWRKQPGLHFLSVETNNKFTFYRRYLLSNQMEF